MGRKAKIPLEEKERQVKSVSFKLTCPIEKGLLDHTAQYTDFSKYVKYLIQQDKDRMRFKRPCKYLKR